jgi:hypothetical protein
MSPHTPTAVPELDMTAVMLGGEGCGLTVVPYNIATAMSGSFRFTAADPTVVAAGLPTTAVLSPSAQASVMPGTLDAVPFTNHVVSCCGEHVAVIELPVSMSTGTGEATPALLAPAAAVELLASPSDMRGEVELMLTVPVTLLALVLALVTSWFRQEMRELNSVHPGLVTQMHPLLWQSPPPVMLMLPVKTVIRPMLTL